MLQGGQDLLLFSDIIQQKLLFFDLISFTVISTLSGPQFSYNYMITPSFSEYVFVFGIDTQNIYKLDVVGQMA